MSVDANSSLCSGESWKNSEAASNAPAMTFLLTPWFTTCQWSAQRYRSALALKHQIRIGFACTWSVHSITVQTSEQVLEDTSDRAIDQQHALTWKHPCSRHARAMSWMASARVAGSLLSLVRLMTGSGRGEDEDEDGSIRRTWLAMEAGKKQAGMPRRQPRRQQASNVCAHSDLP